MPLGAGHDAEYDNKPGVIIVTKEMMAATKWPKLSAKCVYC